MDGASSSVSPIPWNQWNYLFYHLFPTKNTNNKKFDANWIQLAKIIEKMFVVPFFNNDFLPFLVSLFCQYFCLFHPKLVCALDLGHLQWTEIMSSLSTEVIYPVEIHKLLSNHGDRFIEWKRSSKVSFVYSINASGMLLFESTSKCFKQTKEKGDGCWNHIGLQIEKFSQ